MTWEDAISLNWDNVECVDLFYLEQIIGTAVLSSIPHVVLRARAPNIVGDKPEGEYGGVTLIFD